RDWSSDVCSSDLFGQTGPLAGERGDDRIAQAFSGMQFTTGFPDRPPLPVTVPLAEAWSAVLSAATLLMTVFHARRSGHGQVVDIGLYQTALRMQEEVIIRHHRTGAVATPLGTESALPAPVGVRTGVRRAGRGPEAHPRSRPRPTARAAARRAHRRRSRGGRAARGSETAHGDLEKRRRGYGSARRHSRPRSLAV